ncbi:TPA: DUF262 domain-containing protein [Vibrio campbellii]|uniref:DUF262 domain-containing protein n=1 Tax=Vibrio parahaemolyticus TaxID=670 RepID=UPI0032968CC8|nr:DUF262 domain-containing protein [Vibrio campbellii]HDM8222577.1 DUF262 domain-containing protein [Vibrio campbellii]
MKFEDVLGYLDELVGIQLNAINESNEPLVIAKVDRSKSRYYIEATSSTKQVARTFKELRTIWESLDSKGYVSVDQALGGSGSSRHQPETILANLPCIEHFKYERKKHLYLRDYDTHTLGSLLELSASDTKELKKRIDHYRDFDFSLFHKEHSKLVEALREGMSQVSIKYPGESDVNQVNELLARLEELDQRLAISIVNLESSSVDEGQSMSGRNYEEDEEDEEYEEFFGKHEESDPSSSYLVATRITQVYPTVSLLFDRINHGEIDLQPEFQRKDRIWPHKDKARLIESVLLGLPIPVFYFAENSVPMNDDPTWIVIDGLQRTTTLYDFMAGKFDLKYLDRRSDLNGYKFVDLPRKEQRRIREYQIQGHLIQVSSESDAMVRELFQRINTSGKNLSYQEIRSGLYPGSTNRFLKYVAESSDFINSTPLKINPDRMLDLEFVLRATSYIYLGYAGFNYDKYDDFLCETLKKLNCYKFNKNLTDSDEIFVDLYQRLQCAFSSVKKIFGQDAYRKEALGKLNKPIFELLVSTFALMSQNQRDIIESEAVAQAVREEFYKMIKDDSKEYATWSSDSFEQQDRGFDYSISNSTGKAVTIKYRFESFINMINQVAGINFKFKPIKRMEND